MWCLVPSWESTHSGPFTGQLLLLPPWRCSGHVDVLIRKTEGEALNHVIWGEAVPSPPPQIITPSTIGSQTLLNLEVGGSPGLQFRPYENWGLECCFSKFAPQTSKGFLNTVSEGEKKTRNNFKPMHLTHLIPVTFTEILPYPYNCAPKACPWAPKTVV